MSIRRGGLKRERTFGYMPPMKRARTGDVYVPEAMVIGAQQSRVSSALARPRPMEIKYCDYASDSNGDGLLQVASIAAASTWAGCELDPRNDSATLGIGPLGQGSAFYERIGRRITVNKIRIRGEIVIPFQTNQSTADDAGIVRFVLYQDKQTGAAQAQAEQVFDVNSPQLTAANGLPIHYFQNASNFGRFKVWVDKTFRLTPPPISYDGTNVEQAGIYIIF